jgi:hypothetical protein
MVAEKSETRSFLVWAKPVKFIFGRPVLVADGERSGRLFRTNGSVHYRRSWPIPVPEVGLRTPDAARIRKHLIRGRPEFVGKNGLYCDRRGLAHFFV